MDPILRTVVNLPPLSELVLKLNLLLVLCWLIWLSLRRANPRWRVMLWRGCITALVLLPILGALTRGFEVRINIAPRAFATVEAPAELAASSSAASLRTSGGPIHDISSFWAWIWAAGAMLLLGRLVLSDVRVYKLVENSTAAPEKEI